MNPFTVMEMKKNSFTKNDELIYKTICEDPELVPRYSIVDLAKQCGVSQPSITRFCQKLGFDKYTDFKFEMYKYARVKTNVELPSEGVGKIPAIQGYAKLLGELDEVLSVDMINKAISYIMNANHIFISGIQQSFLPAELLQMNLRKLGIYASAINWDGLGDIANLLGDDDLIIVFSVRANDSSPLGRIYNELAGKVKGNIMLITMNEQHPFRKKVDCTICLPPAVRKDYTLRLESQVLFLIFVDILTSYVAIQYK